MLKVDWKSVVVSLQDNVQQAIDMQNRIKSQMDINVGDLRWMFDSGLGKAVVVTVSHITYKDFADGIAVPAVITVYCPESNEIFKGLSPMQLFSNKRDSEATTSQTWTAS